MNRRLPWFSKHVLASCLALGGSLGAAGCAATPDDSGAVASASTVAPASAAAPAGTAASAGTAATTSVHADSLRRFIAGEWRQFVHFDPAATARVSTMSKETAALVRPQAIPASASLRGSMTPVRNQGSRGTCVEFASTGLIEHYLGGDISEQAMVFFHGGNDGANLQYRLGDFLKLGMVDEKLSEYDLSDMNVHIPKNLTYAQLAARSGIAPATPLTESIHGVYGSDAITFVKNSIAAGTPVSFGMFVPDGSMDNGNNIATPAYPTCGGTPITSANIGNCPGHAMIFTGYDDNTQTLEVKNQWGTGWGNGGYGRMTYDFFTRYQAGSVQTLIWDPQAVASSSLTQQIQAVYQQTLGRNALDWEVNAWITNLNGGWTLAKMRTAFEADAQFDDAIMAVYEEAFGREPAAWELSAWETNIRSNGWTITSMKNAFEQPSQAQFNAAITAVYEQVFNREPATWELNDWQQYILQDNWTIPKMRNAFADDQQCLNAIDAVFVSVLGRHATAQELAQYQLHIHDDGWTIAQVKAAI